MRERQCVVRTAYCVVRNAYTRLAMPPPANGAPSGPVPPACGRDARAPIPQILIQTTAVLRNPYSLHASRNTQRRPPGQVISGKLDVRAAAEQVGMESSQP